MLSYLHEDGEMYWDAMGFRASIEVEYKYLIARFDEYYKFEIANVEYGSVLAHKIMRTSAPNRPLIGWCLNPYFGGDEVAPHDVEIYLTRKYR